MNLLNYDPNQKIQWLGNIDQLKNLISDLFGSNGKWSSPGGYAKYFRNDKISVRWYSNKRTLVFNSTLGSFFKKRITDLLKNVLPTEATISNADASNCSSETSNVNHDMNDEWSIENIILKTNIMKF